MKKASNTIKVRKLTQKQKEKLRAKKKEETHQRILKKKRDAYKPIHIKNLRKRQNRRAYLKIKDKLAAQRIRKNDVKGYYKVVLTKNYEMTENLGHNLWLLKAYERFDSLIEENRKGVICEKQIAQSDEQKGETVKYEILLLKKINPDEDDGVRELRDESGCFVRTIISNNNSFAIIAKKDWYIPETYNVYGYNPVSDRKTGRWIFDNIINKGCTWDNIKNVFVCDNKLIVQYTTDLDFILCKTKNECIRLYNALEKEYGPRDNMVLFTGELVDSMKPWLYDIIEKKTGWDRKTLYKKKG